MALRKRKLDTQETTEIDSMKNKDHKTDEERKSDNAELHIENTTKQDVKQEMQSSISVIDETDKLEIEPNKQDYIKEETKHLVSQDDQVETITHTLNSTKEETKPIILRHAEEITLTSSVESFTGKSIQVQNSSDPISPASPRLPTKKILVDEVKETNGKDKNHVHSATQTIIFGQDSYNPFLHVYEFKNSSSVTKVVRWKPKADKKNNTTLQKVSSSTSFEDLLKSKYQDIDGVSKDLFQWQVADEKQHTLLDASVQKLNAGLVMSLCTLKLSSWQDLEAHELTSPFTVTPSGSSTTSQLVTTYAKYEKMTEDETKKLIQELEISGITPPSLLHIGVHDLIGLCLTPNVKSELNKKITVGEEVTGHYVLKWLNEHMSEPDSTDMIGVIEAIQSDWPMHLNVIIELGA
jgi:hypothetical protein